MSAAEHAQKSESVTNSEITPASSLMPSQTNYFYIDKYKNSLCKHIYLYFFLEITWLQFSSNINLYTHTCLYVHINVCRSELKPLESGFTNFDFILLLLTGHCAPESFFLPIAKQTEQMSLRSL